MHCRWHKRKILELYVFTPVLSLFLFTPDYNVNFLLGRKDNVGNRTTARKGFYLTLISWLIM
jgi:hypothetical protein